MKQYCTPKCVSAVYRVAQSINALDQGSCRQTRPADTMTHCVWPIVSYVQKESGFLISFWKIKQQWTFPHSKCWSDLSRRCPVWAQYAHSGLLRSLACATHLHDLPGLWRYLRVCFVLFFCFVLFCCLAKMHLQMQLH